MGLLPVEELGPHLALSARRAVESGNRDRMLKVCRVIAGELLRRGVLIRVAIEGGSQESETFCLVRGTSRLVDLAPLGLLASISEPGERVRVRLPRVESAVDKPPRPVAPAAQPPGSENLASFTGMLGAMEQAQDLDIGDPESGDKSVILAGILSLLGEFLPQLRLFILLPGEDKTVIDHPGLFQVGDDLHEPLWVSHRSPGTSVWIPSWLELPSHVQEVLMRESKRLGEQSEMPLPPFHTAVAVPFREPDWQSVGEVVQSGEAGILVVATHEAWGRTELLRLARRLSRFVTRRWRHQRIVNERIHTDSLTGVHNRAYFDSQFNLELERAKRSGAPLALVLADIDYFKRINDRFGHQSGDEVLEMVARCLQEELRRIDHVCRIGGEEFALVLPHTSCEAAVEVMTRLLGRRITLDLQQAGKRRTLQVALSYGGVTFPDAGADVFELYRKADAMLYLSKEAGRNRCHFWQASGKHISLLPPPLSA